MKTRVLLLLALALAAAVPADAEATFTVSYSSQVGLLISGDGAGEGAVVGFSDATGRFRVLPASKTNLSGAEIPFAALAAGGGCTASAGAVECAATGNRVVTGSLGDGADMLVLATSVTSDGFLDGQGGDDVLEGRDGFDSLAGGPGRDSLDGKGGNDSVDAGDGDDRVAGDGGGTDTIRMGAGNDVFTSGEAPLIAPDLVDGGAGFDTADYSNRTGRQQLSTQVGTTDTPNDGLFLEGDDLDNVERLKGGGGVDSMRVGNAGTTTPATVYEMTGGGGNDTLTADGAIRTAMNGEAGSDTINGGSATDGIFSREGEADTITCGGGLDRLTADLRDIPLSRTCEQVDQGAVKEGPNVDVVSRSVSVGRDGGVSVRLRCPRALKRPCAGRLGAKVERRGANYGRRTSYSIKPGKTASVEAKLPASQRAAARRRGARVGVISVEKGTHGPKTTLDSLASR